MNRAADIVLPELAPVAAPRAQPWLDGFELGLLGAIWGASFLFQRVSAPEFGALPLGEIRLALGAAVLLPFLWRDRAAFPPRLWPRIALVAFLFFGERIRLRQGVALVAGFAGVVVLAGAKTAGMSLGWAVAAGTSAAFLYGIGVNLIRHWLAGLPPIALAAGTLSAAALVLAPFAIASWPAGRQSGIAWAAAVALGVVCSGIAYALYYRLIQRIGGARAVTVTYLVPLFAVAWAWMLLAEVPTLAMLAAGALILGSVALSQKK
jgi:drug/metabolite transporter (DMT)-like permease